MPIDPLASRVLEQEARALLTRLARLRPYALHMPMVVAATISPAAQTQVESHMIQARGAMHRMVHGFLAWLRTPEGRQASPSAAQQRFTLLRLRFNAVISQFEIFKDVLSQRSEHVTGVWVAGLDDVAADAHAAVGRLFRAAAGHLLPRPRGTAPRSAAPAPGCRAAVTTRSPSSACPGSVSWAPASPPVWCTRSGTRGRPCSTWCVAPSRDPSGGAHAPASHRVAWTLWERWISEIVADFWSVAKLGIGSTLGLMGVVSLPRAFVFRIDTDDPHPVPWIRMWLSCGIGDRLYPHPQWTSLARLWESFYPREGLERRPPARARRAGRDGTGAGRAAGEPSPGHPGRALAGRGHGREGRQPARLAQLYGAWGGDPERMRDAPPTLVFAVLGQARADGKLTPEDESRALGNLLTYWAVKSALTASADCSTRPRKLTVRAARSAETPIRIAI